MSYIHIYTHTNFLILKQQLIIKSGRLGAREQAAGDGRRLSEERFYSPPKCNTYVYVYVYVCICVCMYVCIYIYIYIYVCMYIYIYIYARVFLFPGSLWYAPPELNPPVKGIVPPPSLGSYIYIYIYIYMLLYSIYTI